MPVYSTENLGFTELRAAAELVKAHSELQENLRALLAFGPIVATGVTHDLDLLNVVEGWQGLRRVAFSSSEEVPLRGRMTVFFLTPEEFEHPDDTPLPGLDFSARQLMYRVQEAYAVLVEEPDGYAFDTMRRFDTSEYSLRDFFTATVPLAQR